MTASYVIAAAAVVLIVEGFASAILLPQIQSQDDLLSRVDNTALLIADKLGTNATNGTLDVQPASMGSPDVRAKPGEVLFSGKTLQIPLVMERQPASPALTVGLVLDPKGVVLSTSFPALFPTGVNAGVDLPSQWSKGGNGIGLVRGNKLAWATAPIFPLGRGHSPKPGSTFPDPLGVDKSKLLGFVYIQAPLQAPAALSQNEVQPLIGTGVALLLATIPVGVLFGLMTTRGAVRRLGRLAAGTVGFAGGDFSTRIRESGSDEIAQLERHFNQMADRLDQSIAEQRGLDERNARLSERSRISRELHDSISQDLFSLSTLAAGLRKALPSDATVQPQLLSISQTVASMIREMRALLLELRPTALDEKGLVPALEDLCQAYEERVGVRITMDLESVALDSSAEHALFRVAQEGLANAARHAEAGEIALRLRPAPGGAELVVTDNGRGFDRKRSAAGQGLGLKLMAERVQVQGGTVAIKSRPGSGTELRVLLPSTTT